MRSNPSTGLPVLLGVLLLEVAASPWGPAPGSPASARRAFTYSVSVTPRDSALGDLFADSTGFTVAFTVTNTGTSSDTYNMSCDGTNIVCVSLRYNVITLSPNQSIQEQVTFNTAHTTGMSFVYLYAESPNKLGQGWYTFSSWPKVNNAVIVTPVAGTGPNVNSLSSGFKAGFTVKNIGLQRDSFNLTCEPAANIACTSQTPTSTPGLNAFASTVDTITYATGASGASFIASSAVSGNSFATGRWNFTVLVGPGSGVAVTPDGQAVGVRASVSASRPFTVKNTGTASNTYTITATCSGSAIASGCTRSPTSLTLAAGVTGTATVSYTSGASGSGTITLKAKQTTDTTVKDTGWVNLSIGSMQAPTADVVAVNPGTMLERDLCVAVALAAASASECGDLRLAHPLPAVRTLMKTRVPMLVYSSAMAHPYPLVAANVTLPAGAANPDTLAATLLVNGVARDSGKWSGAGLSPGRASRIVLGYDGLAQDTTGIYNYTLQVANRYNGQSLLATSSTGQLVVVKRDSSSFGAGWWLAGLELLKNPSPTATTILWVGGDGSAHPYRAAPGSNVWAGDSLDHPDTLKWNGTQYIRYLPAGLQVRFDAQGRHVSTINRLGDTTKFHYDVATGRLDTLTVPPASAAARWIFTYTNGQLTSVKDTILGAAPRTTTLTVSGRQVTAIKDPDSTTVSFAYDGSLTNRINARTNRRGFKTSFTFDAGSRVTKDSLDPGSGQPVIVTQLRALESQGLHTTPAGDVVDTAVAYTLLDGPRTDVGDSTRLWLDRYGEPTRVVNALGRTTLLSRTDAHWPALVTRVQQPNGRVILATYDARGHDSTTTDSGTVVNGQVAVTRYVWNMTWDEVERIILPEQDSTVFHYDSTNGNRMWQRDGRGTLSQVTYGYSPTKRLTSIRLPGATAADSFHYDAVRGNVDSTWTPLGFRAASFTDALGRDTLALTPIDSAQTKLQRRRLIYDLADRVTDTWSIGPPMSNKLDTLTSFTPDTISVSAETVFVANTYDAEGNLAQTLSWTDPAPIEVYLRDTRSYDGANRVLSVRLGSGPTSFTYDAAGNAVRARYGNGFEVTTTYDALNRATRRVVPYQDYAKTTSEGHPPGPISDFMVFPLYPNNGTGYRVAADTSTFTYDSAGNVVEADNLDARISRTYFPNGALQTDTLRLRALTGTSFAPPTGLRYGYDRDGRRTWMKLPANLASGDSVTYTYSPTLGALTQLRDNGGRVARFTYDPAARLDSVLILPAGSGTPGVTETRGYDADSRLRWRLRRTAAGTVLPQDSLVYDARGKTVQSLTWSAAKGHQNERTTMAYAGLGAVVGSEVATLVGAPSWQAEEFRTDAMGNVWYGKTSSTAAGVDSARWGAFTMNGALTSMAARACTGYPTLNVDTLYEAVDLAGNVKTAGQLKRTCVSGGVTLEVAARHFLRADNRLAAIQRYVFNASSYRDGTWEEYRYDALGRRVLERGRRDSTSLCNVVGGCQSFVQRTVWDGDQVLFEERHTGSDFSGGAPYYGTIGYLHGGGIDAPLWLLDTRFSDARVINYNWRGLAESSVWPNGNPADCSLMGGTCTTISWPAGQGVYYRSAPPPGGTPITWIGSLPANGQDGTGMLYRRNRYYDPAAGRFTQEDPLGLAGGLNLYGFAGGDPVNFSDPFGLCDKEKDKGNCTQGDVSKEDIKRDRSFDHRDFSHNCGHLGNCTQSDNGRDQAIRTRQIVDMLSSSVMGLAGGFELPGGGEAGPVVFSGSKIGNAVAKLLGIERRDLGNRIEVLKEGLPGNENVVITKDGHVFHKATGEYLGNVHDIPPQK